MENGKKIPIVNKLKCSILVLSMFFCGCGYHDQIPSRPVEISGKHNTFKVEARRISLFKKEKVKAMQICEPPDNTASPSINKMKIYWWIVAEQPVDAESLEITAGVVPDGFVQKIPSDGKVFVPVPGKRYRIGVEMDYPLAPHWMGIDWIAE